MSEDSAKWLEGTHQVRVYYEDTDFSGYVYHANYLKYFERAREELVGIDWVKKLYERGFHYVVARVDLSFHAPARHGDLIEVRSRMRLSASPVCLVEQEAWLLPDGGKPAVKLTSAKIKLAAVDDSGEATRVPPDVVQYFEKLYGALKT